MKADVRVKNDNWENNGERILQKLEKYIIKKDFQISRYKPITFHNKTAFEYLKVDLKLRLIFEHKHSRTMISSTVTFIRYKY